MTAKEKLLQYVAELTEDEAIDALPWIVRLSPQFPPAPPEVLAQLRNAIVASDNGAPRYSTTEVRRFVGLE